MSQSWRDKLTGLKAAGVELDLPLLLALASTHKLTEDEDAAIRRNLIDTELLAQNPQLRRSRAEALVKEAQGSKPNLESQQ